MKIDRRKYLQYSCQPQQSEQNWSSISLAPCLLVFRLNRSHICPKSITALLIQSSEFKEQHCLKS